MSNPNDPYGDNAYGGVSESEPKSNSKLVRIATGSVAAILIAVGIALWFVAGGQTPEEGESSNGGLMLTSIILIVFGLASAFVSYRLAGANNRHQD